MKKFIFLLIIMLLSGCSLVDSKLGEKTIELYGDGEIYLEVGNIYDEPGASISRGKLKVSGDLDVNEVGTYKLIYSDTRKTILKERIVHVIDTTSPEISLNGEDSITLFLKEEYFDEGVSVSDNYDTNPKVFTEGSFDTNVLGEQTITYTVVDSSNNKAIITRNLFVKLTKEVDNDYNNSYKQTSASGGYIIDNSDYSKSDLIKKVNDELVWKHTLSDFIRDPKITIDKNNNVIIYDLSMQDYSGYVPYLEKYDYDGNKLWSTFLDTQIDYISQVIDTGSSYIISASNYANSVSSKYIIGIDHDGTKIFELDLSNENGIHGIFIVPTQEGFLVSAHYNRRPSDDKPGNYIQKFTFDGKLISSHNIDAVKLDYNIISTDDKVIFSLRNYKDQNGVGHENGLFTYRDDTNEIITITDLGNTITLIMEKLYDGTIVLICQDAYSGSGNMSGDTTYFMHLNEDGTIIKSYEINELSGYKIYSFHRFFSEEGLVFSGVNKDGDHVNIMVSSNAYN